MTKIITESTYIYDKALGMHPLSSTPEKKGNSGRIYTSVISGASELMYADDSNRVLRLSNKGNINIDRTRLVNGDKEVILDNTDGKLSWSGVVGGPVVNFKNENVLIGAGAGKNITTGSNNVIIGQHSGSSTESYIFAVASNEKGTSILQGKMDQGYGDTTSYLDVGAETFSVLSPLSGDSLFRIQSGRLTSNDTVPDVTFGGLSLKADGSDGDSVLSLQSSALDNETVSFGYERTFGKFGAMSKNYGSLFIAGIGIESDYTQIGSRGICMQAYAKATSHKLISTASRGAFEIDTIKIDTGSLEYWDDEDVLFNVRNNGNTVFFIRGDGGVYADSTFTTYDDEEDIKLARSFSDKKDPYFERLIDLGIISSDGMCNIQKLGMLSIGAAGQLFNIVRELARRLGLEEEELYELAKVY